MPTLCLPRYRESNERSSAVTDYGRFLVFIKDMISTHGRITPFLSAKSFSACGIAYQSL